MYNKIIKVFHNILIHHAYLEIIIQEKTPNILNISTVDWKWLVEEEGGEGVGVRVGVGVGVKEGEEE